MEETEMIRIMSCKFSHCENCHVIYRILAMIVVLLLMLDLNWSCLG